MLLNIGLMTPAAGLVILVADLLPLVANLVLLVAGLMSLAAALLLLTSNHEECEAYNYFEIHVAFWAQFGPRFPKRKSVERTLPPLSGPTCKKLPLRAQQLIMAHLFFFDA